MPCIVKPVYTTVSAGFDMQIAGVIAVSARREKTTVRYAPIATKFCYSAK